MSQPGVGPLTKGPINRVTKLELYPTFNGKQLVNAEQGATQPYFRKSVWLQGGHGREGPRSEAGRPVRASWEPAASCRGRHGGPDHLRGRR